MTNLNIAMVSSEMAPLAKSGGLADVVAALPEQLSQQGHHVAVFMPAFREALASCEGRIEDLHLGFPISLGDSQVAARVLRTTAAGGQVAVYLIDQPRFFDRDGLYFNEYGDYNDNCARFVFFNRAVLEAIRRLNLPLDIIHCHDWQAGLIPAYLHSGVERLEHCPLVATVMTIHNLGYQGVFWVYDYHMTELPWELYTAQGLEFYNNMSFLKAGIVYADRVTTVSRQYAEEIRRPEFGCGLDGVLRDRGDRLRGIVNGVDYRVWDPSTDPHLPRNFSVSDWVEGKAACKAALQEELQLERDPSKMMIGLVGRLATQKGWDLTLEVLPKWLDDRSIQWVILGNGQPEYQQRLTELRDRHGDRLSFAAGFSEPLAHRIEAASDLFLMPSQYEPCGLNQLYSLRYGTPPLVHAVGGLVDTVSPWEPEKSNSSATGFSFDRYNAAALDRCLTTAVDLYRHNRAEWNAIVQRGMSQDWSWNASAAQYVDVYRQAVRDRQSETAATPEG